MASATRADGDVAFAKAGENLEPAATAAVEARPQGNAEARPALAADRCACCALALSIEPWMSPLAGRVVAVALAGRFAVAGAGRVAVVVGTRGGAGGVGGASTATGAGIAAGGRLADQGADGAICWRSIDGWLLPADAGGRLGCSVDGLLGGPILLVSAPGAACMVPFIDQCGGCCSLVGTCCHKIERAASVATAEGWTLARGASGPSRTQRSKPPSDASEARLVALLSNERAVRVQASMTPICIRWRGVAGRAGLCACDN